MAELNDPYQVDEARKRREKIQHGICHGCQSVMVLNLLCESYYACKLGLRYGRRECKSFKDKA